MDEKCNILCWKPGDPLTQVRRVVGEGARESGIKDLGMGCDFSLSPTGEIFVADYQNETLVSFRNGSGHLVLDELQGSPVSSCSPSGILYALTDKALHKWEGTRLQTLTTFESLPEDPQFSFLAMFVTKEEVMPLITRKTASYASVQLSPSNLLWWDRSQLKPDLCNFLGTDDGTIYVADHRQSVRATCTLQFWFRTDRCSMTGSQAVSALFRICVAIGAEDLE